MPTAAVALLLTAAVAHAAWNYLAKGAAGTLAFTFAFTALAAVLYLPLAIGAYVWTRQDLGLDALIFVAVSGAIDLAYFLLLLEGYRHGDLSLVYPVARGAGPTIAVAGGIIIFAERPSPLALVGGALIVAGILVMSLSPHALSGVDAGRSIAFALAAGVCIGAYTLWDKKGVSIVTPILYDFGRELARGALIAPFAVGSAARRASVGAVFRDQRRALVGVALLSPAAYILVLAALTLAPVSYVAPGREVSILIGALLGVRLLGEADAARRLLGASAIVAGGFALAFG